MPERPRLEAAGAALALLACVAFVASFAFGIGRVGGSREAVLEPDVHVVNVPVAAGRVEVLNATSRSGLARAVTQRLRDAGFDVVFFGNASESAGDSTTVLDRIGDDAVARAVAEHLGITRVRTERDTALYLDATVIIGDDWQ